MCRKPLQSRLYSRLTGPYAPAVLRFQISFPPTYPALPPLVTFSTDVFHPLLTPLTTYTYTTGSTDTDTVSATDEERLPPGGFSLRHGFPHWFGRSRRSAPSSRDVSGSALGSPASATPAPSDLNVNPGAPGAPLPTQEISIVRILEYIRSTFSEESILDSLPLEAAANPGAYHAWRAHRAPIVQAHQPTSPSPEPSTSEKSEGNSTLGRNRRPGEWNWEGVWEERVKKAVKASLSEPVLYGTGAGEDIVRSCSCAPVLVLTDMIDTLPRGRRGDAREDEVASRGCRSRCRALTSRLIGSRLTFLRYLARTIRLSCASGFSMRQEGPSLFTHLSCAFSFMTP